MKATIDDRFKQYSAMLIDFYRLNDWLTPPAPDEEAFRADLERLAIDNSGNVEHIFKMLKAEIDSNSPQINI